MYQVEQATDKDYGSVRKIFPAMINGERKWQGSGENVQDVLAWAKAQGYGFQNWTFGSANEFCPELNPLESQSAILIY